FRLRKLGAILGANGGAAGGGAKAPETVAQSRGGTTSRRRRIVQFVGQPGGKLAQRGQLFVLLFLTRDVPNPVRKQTHQMPDEFGEDKEHLHKMRDVEGQVMRGNNGPPRYGDDFEAGKRKHAADFPTIHGEYGAVSWTTFCSSANLAFEHDNHKLRLVSF